jgi:hypothetical protein
LKLFLKTMSLLVNFLTYYLELCNTVTFLFLTLTLNWQ